MLLAGDVGGTKTSLVIFDTATGPRAPLAETTLPSDDFASLEDLVGSFLAKTALPVTHAAFGVAGPVVEGSAKITNLPWTISEQGLAAALGLTGVHLLNDLEAVATAVPYLDADDLLTLNVGDSADGGAIAVVAPGTGLGQAFLTWDGHRYRAHPSEGGHTDFAPLTERQAGLLRFLQGQYDHVSYERVCSGLGIPNLYQFVRDSDPTSEPADLAAVLAKADDRTPLIVQRALADSDPTTLCRQTMSLFIEILAAAASNLALSTLATGGVYLGGGIPPRILPLLTPATFLPAFQNKGRFRDLCERMPVHVILNPQAALLGASYAVNTDLAHYDGEERGAGRRPS